MPTSAIAHPEAIANRSGPVEPEHDFGVILARGQTLHHKFTLANPTDKDIRLFDAIALTPCCSAIGPLPEVIPSGGTVDVPVTFKPEHASGRKRVEFVIRTGLAQGTAWTLVLTASMSPDMDFRWDEDSDRSLLVGQSGRQSLSIVCRRIGDLGLDAPETVEATPPLTARFLGPGRVHVLPGGLVEAIREVEILVPASHRDGERRGTLHFHWGRDESREHPVSWTVSPCMRVTPSGFVLKPEAAAEPRTVLIRSADRPFRILDIAGPLSTESALDRASEPNRSHSLTFALDPVGVERGGPTDVTITTDHPGQSTVTISVLIVPE